MTNEDGLPKKTKKLFWIHIKKAGGTTIRSLISPYYVEVDRVRKPKNFTQASTVEYNDILNNYRVVLGEYQFKRALFAKEYLFPCSWDTDIYSFAFCREPIDRCLSMFSYMYWKNRGFLCKIFQVFLRSFQEKKLIVSKSSAFDAFIDCLECSRFSDSIYHPLGLHFRTHTNPVWEDITDRNGNIIINDFFKLENLESGLNFALDNCGIDSSVKCGDMWRNSTGSANRYCPSIRQRKRLEALYSDDFYLYRIAK